MDSEQIGIAWSILAHVEARICLNLKKKKKKVCLHKGFKVFVFLFLNLPTFDGSDDCRTV